MDYADFFNRKAEDVARDLIGRFVSRNMGNENLIAKIVETGAYEGGKEIDSRKGMKYSTGKIFLMPYRGHYFLNIAIGKEDFSSCVEIRKVELNSKIINGPGAVSNALNITSDLEGIMLGEELQIVGESIQKSKIKKLKGGPKNCLGYFREW